MRHIARMNSKFELAAKLWQMDRLERRLTIEAAILLAVSRALTSFVPFRHIARLASRPVRNNARPAENRAAMAERVRLAVRRCAARMPWRALCFEQAFAAQSMLRRRGVDAVLYYGAAVEHANGLAAHVWVRDGETDVIGCELAADYAVLAMFPARRAT